MKIKIGNMKFPLNTLIRVEWNKFYPQLVIHEKFEKHIKWTLRVIAFIGIASSIISISEWYVSLGIAIVIFLLEQLLEKILFEYTTFILQPLPDFKIDFNQWRSNGFLMPQVTNENLMCYFGPAYKDEEYAHKFFTYIKSWNSHLQEDIQNIVCVSFILESDNTYTTCIYANPNRENLDEMFSEVENASRLKKYGKKHQKFFVQMNYWHNLPYRESYFIHQFLNFPHIGGKEFIFAPFVITDPVHNQVKCLYDLAFKKFHYKIKRRDDVKEYEPEYRMKPQRE